MALRFPDAMKPPLRWTIKPVCGVEMGSVRLLGLDGRELEKFPLACSLSLGHEGGHDPGGVTLPAVKEGGTAEIWIDPAFRPEPKP